MQDMNGEQVSDAEVQQILEAANWAPTHGKTEPWRFAVLASPSAQREAFNLMLQVHTYC
jgi:nitroreductase